MHNTLLVVSQSLLHMTQFKYVKRSFILSKKKCIHIQELKMTICSRPGDHLQQLTVMQLGPKQQTSAMDVIQYYKI